MNHKAGWRFTGPEDETRRQVEPGDCLNLEGFTAYQKGFIRGALKAFALNNQKAGRSTVIDNAGGAASSESVGVKLSPRRRTAFHEAGHVAAMFFTGQAGDPLAASLDAETGTGVAIRERWREPQALLDMDDQRGILIEGRRRMLTLLAGMEAVWKVEMPSFETRYAKEDDEAEVKGTDACIARQTAEMMDFRHMPPSRSVTLAERWTREMLDLPAVWKAVQHLVVKLLDREEIAPEELRGICGRFENHCVKLSKWRRRFTVESVEQGNP